MSVQSDGQVDDGAWELSMASALAFTREVYVCARGIFSLGPGAALTHIPAGLLS